MKRNNPRKQKAPKAITDDIFVEEDNFQEPKEWTIISALDRVLDRAEDSELSDEFWETCKNPLNYLRQQLELTNIQIVVLAIMIEEGETITWKDLGDFLSISRLSMMVYSEEIEDLVTKRWIYHTTKSHFGSNWQGFHLVYGVVTALRNNQKFIPEKIDGLTTQQFVDKIERRFDKHDNSRDYEFTFEEDWLMLLLEANPDLPFCRETLTLQDKHERSLLMMILLNYAHFGDSEDEGFNIGRLDNLYDEDASLIRIQLNSGVHELQLRGLIEYKCEDGLTGNNMCVLTKKTKTELLAGYTPSRSRCMPTPKDDQVIKQHTAIKEKELFYNPSDQQQIAQLTKLLCTDNLPSVQQRLEEQGLRKGFACLFYGAPGTGKTETVLQIARQTGRDLMQVDIAGLRDKWVGESEKNIKAVFTRYRKLCEESDIMPILFFNEADAVINKRNENAERSVDKMDNSMQNIILQEIEDLDGILIATTNLTSNLDRAFERRFLYKVEFHKPDTDVKTRIWQSMLTDISQDEARQLAAHFDFSGGQIENIARKRTVEYIISGKRASLAEIEDYCRAELLTGKNSARHPIGFRK